MCRSAMAMAVENMDGWMDCYSEEEEERI